MLKKRTVRSERIVIEDDSESGLHISAVVEAGEDSEKCTISFNGDVFQFARFESVDTLVRVATAARDAMKSHADARKVKAAAGRAK